jgi:hypothetical protein
LESDPLLFTVIANIDPGCRLFPDDISDGTINLAL